MRKALGLPFDPIDRAARIWEHRFGPSSAMAAVTSIMRAQQILLAELDAILRPYGLTFARYEALVLLSFSRAGALPLRVIGERLMVHPTSVTNTIDRLEAQGMVVRRPNPVDGRGRLAEITERGRDAVQAATRDLMNAEFGMGEYTEREPAQQREEIGALALGVVAHAELGIHQVAGRHPDRVPAALGDFREPSPAINRVRPPDHHALRFQPVDRVGHAGRMHHEPLPDHPQRQRPGAAERQQHQGLVPGEREAIRAQDRV